MSKKAPNPYLNLKINPAPGSVDAVQGLIDALNKARTALDDARTATTAVANAQSEIWKGEAADGFRKDLREKLPVRLDKASQSFSRASTELLAWRGMLTAHKDNAQRLDTEAGAAKQKIAAAEGVEQQAGAHPDLKLAGRQAADDIELRNLQTRYDSAMGALNQAKADANAARQALKDIERRAEQLQDVHEQDAKGVSSRLDDADDIAPHKPKKSAWDKVKGAVKGAVNALEKAADYISAAAGVLALAALIVGLASPLGPLLLITAGVLSALAAVGHGSEFIKNPGMDTFVPFALDVIGVIPGVTAAKSVVAGTAATAAGAPASVQAAAQTIAAFQALKNGVMAPVGAADQLVGPLQKVIGVSGATIGATVAAFKIGGVEVDTSFLDAVSLGLSF
ncbi:hypothetical protein OG216_17605 [Streptomycetaceae bacterium NBC_01309]